MKLIEETTIKALIEKLSAFPKDEVVRVSLEIDMAEKPKKSRWAKLAKKMAEENYLGDGAGAIFRQSCL